MQSNESNRPNFIQRHKRKLATAALLATGGGMGGYFALKTPPRPAEQIIAQKEKQPITEEQRREILESAIREVSALIPSLEPYDKLHTPALTPEEIKRREDAFERLKNAKTNEEIADAGTEIILSQRAFGSDKPISNQVKLLSFGLASSLKATGDKAETETALAITKIHQLILILDQPRPETVTREQHEKMIGRLVKMIGDLLPLCEGQHEMLNMVTNLQQLLQPPPPQPAPPL